MLNLRALLPTYVDFFNAVKGGGVKVNTATLVEQLQSYTFIFVYIRG